MTIIFPTEGSLDIELFFVPSTVQNDAFTDPILVCGNITNSNGEFGNSPIRVMLIPQFDDETSTVPSGSSLILVYVCMCVCV